MSSELTKVLTYFTPSNLSTLDKTDADTGSGGVLAIPSSVGKSSLATAAGKYGTMYLLDTSRTNRVLGSYSIGGCWCGESHFTGWDGVARIVSSGGNQITVWRLHISKNSSLAQESVSQSLPVSAQDPGFLTSVSSDGTGNAIVWAVGRPVSGNPNVTLYAFGPQAAAGGNNGWLFSAVAGIWPNVNGNANIVPVVANGRVYVASYKQLAVFGLAGAAAKPAAVRPPMPPAPVVLPLDSHEIYGTIKTVTGGNVTLATRTGQLVRVDAADAADRHRSVVLQVGEPVTVFGGFGGSGVLHATSVLHAKPSPQGWPADR
jgi:hypothetical protein